MCLRATERQEELTGLVFSLGVVKIPRGSLEVDTQTHLEWMRLFHQCALWGHKYEDSLAVHWQFMGWIPVALGENRISCSRHRTSHTVVDSDFLGSNLFTISSFLYGI
jgi:hypothetical protein